MTTSENVQAQVDEAAKKYMQQSNVVSSLRANASCSSEDLKAAEMQLRELKRALDQVKKRQTDLNGPTTANDTSQFNRNGTEGLLKRRFFIAPSFEIYGGVAGLYDYGPPGCAVKNNLIAVWKQHFIVEEGMMELEASCLTPAPVLKASGHVDKFHDLLVTDVETKECFRADHLLFDRLNQLIDGNDKDFVLSSVEKEKALALRERLDELDEKEMDECIEKYQARAPETGNKLSPSYPFNLMFQTSIGPTAQHPGFLRPETAQGIFVNFKRLLEFGGGKLPFACAQIGLSFRNEIAPKAGLIRVREFQQAEIEHFVNAEDKRHPKFESVRNVKINMYGRMQQMTPPYQTILSTIGEAVDEGIIANETLGYFIGRTSEFVRKVGMDMKHVRFRQHLEHEMAHYASDCWDLEVNCSYGWIECAGLADRSAFDLGIHSEKSGTELTARELYPEPRDVESLVCMPIKSALGKAFKRDAQGIIKAIEALDEQGVTNLKKEMESNGKADVNGVSVNAELVSFQVKKKRVTGRSFYPAVIEPSFGIGRILSCLWEHTYYVREGDDEARAVLALPACIAPVKCTVLPLSKNEVFNGLLGEIRAGLSTAGLLNRVDDSGQSIGKRYARSDEIGTPFCVTVDFDSRNDNSITVRERDSTTQIRCSISDAVKAISDLVEERAKWSDICEKCPVVSS